MTSSSYLKTCSISAEPLEYYWAWGESNLLGLEGHVSLFQLVYLLTDDLSFLHLLLDCLDVSYVILMKASTRDVQDETIGLLDRAHQYLLCCS